MIRKIHKTKLRMTLTRRKSTSSMGSCSTVSSRKGALDDLKNHQHVGQSRPGSSSSSSRRNSGSFNAKHYGLEETMNARIQVCTRLRPLQERERLEEEEELPFVTASRRVTISPDGEQDVFDKVGLPLVNDVCGGYNAAIVAYGQTGSGKTYSMLGGGTDIWKLAEMAVKQDMTPPTKLANIFSNSQRGITPRALERIFQYMNHEAPGKGLKVRCVCSYMEIYNEQVYDLLLEGNDKRILKERGLEIFQDNYNGVYVPNLMQVPVSTMNDVLQLLWKGAINRAVDATDMNEYSSRSHTVFQVVLEQENLDVGGTGRMHKFKSKLNLVDLAGSEKWRTHQLATFSNQRIAEMTNINKSLSNLGNCIRALLEKKQHVPYRNSKLTRLLQDSLGGNSKTSFLITLSPSVCCLEETYSSLQFADRAKRVVLQVSINQTFDDGTIIQQLMERVKSLEAELERVTSTTPTKENNNNNNNMKDVFNLKQNVDKAAQKLKQWNEKHTLSKPRLDDSSILKLYEKWLYSTLVSKNTSVDELEPHERLAMAEWAVLMQAQQLKALKKQ